MNAALMAALMGLMGELPSITSKLKQMVSEAESDDDAKDKISKELDDIISLLTVLKEAL